MTLSKQLVGLIAVLLLLVFAGTFLISVHHTRDYLQRQLESHAQDAATSLGLSLSAHLADNDLATVTSMTDAIFDRGFYRVVRVENMQGKPLVDRVLPVQLEGVPNWFINALPLITPEGVSILMDGWVEVGRVVVLSHPGFAYNQLWQTAFGTLRWFLLSAAVALIIGGALLRQVLKPLKLVEQQADAICNRDFPVLEKMPRTREMRRIVEAMNRMSRKVHQMLDELEQLAAGLRRKAYQHPVTELPNKRFFMDNLANLIRSSEEFFSGAICLIQLKDFKGYNDSKGYEAGDNLLRVTAKQLETMASKWPRGQLAHLTGADFVMLIEDCTRAQAGRLGEDIASVLGQMYGTGLLDAPDVGHIGVAYFDGQQTVSELLSEADMSLRMAQAKGANGWHLNAPGDVDTEQVRGGSEWRKFINLALERDLVTLQYQPVVGCVGKELLHQEVLIRFPQDLDRPGKELLTAGLFMPQAESLGMTADIDKAVIRKVMRNLQRDPAGDSCFAINISTLSIQTEGFVSWLERFLAEHRQLAPRLIFELPEYGVVALLDEVSELLDMVSRYGSRFSLDHFGRSFSSLAYLRSLKVHYLKIDGSFMRSLDKSKDNQFFVQALTEIAHGLEIKVLAESVESAVVWDLLPSLHVDGGQGYFLGRPE